MTDLFITAVLWYISGVASFIYWWTTDRDLETSTLWLMLLVGVCGPFAFPMGYLVHGKKMEPTILTKKKGNK